MDWRKRLGVENNKSVLDSREDLLRILNLKLFSTGLPRYEKAGEPELFKTVSSLVEKFREKSRLLAKHLCPVDQRIQDYINGEFRGTPLEGRISVPSQTVHLDQHGLARALSLPPDRNVYKSQYVTSYRVTQGILHNPASDRRTTKGTFHIADSGPLIQSDKLTVPKLTFGRLLQHALNPPNKLMELPFTSTQVHKAKAFTSLYLRPKVSPEVFGVLHEKSLEIRFLAPGGLVSNLDFVESIFGNAGDPYLPQNNAAFDIEHFSGHTGCVILAPHLTGLTKKELGLPHIKDATERQKEQGMCWSRKGDLYNDGQAFKAVLRNGEGKTITLISDNYFGYCKKEVKTQISYAANLLGLCEEEHAGGALVYPSFSLGEYYYPDKYMHKLGHRFAEVRKNLAGVMDVMPQGYGVDKQFPNIKYVPENAVFDLPQQKISWKFRGKNCAIKLLPGETYFYPTGYKIRMLKHPGAPSWRLVGIMGEGTFFHKPSTVSGGGKSEISKSIEDSMIYKSFYVPSLAADLDRVEAILSRDYSDRFKVKWKKKPKSRRILSSERSLGSVIKLLTPSSEYSDEYNAWLKKIPIHVLSLVYAVKRFYVVEWGEDWRRFFTVDLTDGQPGNELHFNHRKLIASYARVGLSSDGDWRVFRLRIDYIPSMKVQMEDDISCSVTVGAHALQGLNPQYENPSVKLIENCEYRLFQRPDEAVHKGYDKQAEADLARPNTFLSNFEPLPSAEARAIMEEVMEYEKFTEPMKKLIETSARNGADEYFVCSSVPRMINGKPTPNMRYLQDRLDIQNPEDRYIGEMGMRLRRRLTGEKKVWQPVNSVFIGRRNNPPDREKGIKPLAVYNPLHYQDLPELFMDFISSLTGKSPSTTGAGSEGALTKGPFNSLCTVIDLNNALTSALICEYHVFSTPAEYIGHKFRVDHDLSLLIPELWARLSPQEREPKYLIDGGYLSPLKDFIHGKRKVLASRLGYRINKRFAAHFLGRIFANPISVFPDEMLRPELQNRDDFADGIENICRTQQRIAAGLIEDGSVELACPPLEALIHIMAVGEWQGLKASSPGFRKMFTREHMLKSKWYRKRLLAKQKKDVERWRSHVETLNEYTGHSFNRPVVAQLKLADKLKKAKSRWKKTARPEYLDFLKGTIGLDPAVLSGPREN